MDVIYEFKSHSSFLYNERLSILIYQLDFDALRMNMDYNDPELLKRVYAHNMQIYKNIRMVIRADPVMRKQFRLNTKDSGIYVTDIHLSTISKMIQECEVSGYSPKRCSILCDELNSFEVSWKDILQHYSYFIRIGLKSKPDMLYATQKYKDQADSATLEQLREIVGTRHKIDFDSIALMSSEFEEDTEPDEDAEDSPFDEDEDD